MKYILFILFIILFIPAFSQNTAFTGSDPTPPGDPTITAIEKEVRIMGIHAYPNPFFDQVQFDYEIVKPGKVQIFLYDAAGNVVLTIDKNHETIGKFSIVYRQILTSGAYYLTSMFDNTRMPVQRLIRR